MLLQNAPHDSICGCSIDEAHREMEVRFAKVNQVGNFVKTNLLNEWKGKLATQKAQSEHLFTVINTGLHNKVDTVSTIVDVAVCPFKELHPTEGFKKMAALSLPDYHVEDLDGHLVEAEIEDLGQALAIPCLRINSVNLILHVKCAWQFQFTLHHFLGQASN